MALYKLVAGYPGRTSRRSRCSTSRRSPTAPRATPASTIATLRELVNLPESPRVHRGHLFIAALYSRRPVRRGRHRARRGPRQHDAVLPSDRGVRARATACSSSSVTGRGPRSTTRSPVAPRTPHLDDVYTIAMAHYRGGSPQKFLDAAVRHDGNLTDPRTSRRAQALMSAYDVAEGRASTALEGAGERHSRSSSMRTRSTSPRSIAGCRGASGARGPPDERRAAKAYEGGPGGAEGSLPRATEVLDLLSKDSTRPSSSTQRAEHYSSQVRG